MSVKSRHRSRSSVDRVLDLLVGLDEHQMENLLLEAESTISSNIAVSKAIDLFERPTSPQPQSPPRRQFLTSLSPRKQSDLRRRQSKRASSAQEPLISNTRPKPTIETSQPSKKTSRAYRRISRPCLPLPTPAATPDICDLLAAYLLDPNTAVPGLTSSPASSSTQSFPATPQSAFSPSSLLEPDTPALDLLEPSPTRAPRTHNVFGNPMKEPTNNISGIFEVLDDVEHPNDSLHL